MEKLKQNKYIILVVLIILCLAFYWYELRPNIIKKECYNMGAYGMSNKDLLKYLTPAQAVDSDNWLFKRDYNNCLLKHGILLSR